MQEQALVPLKNCRQLQGLVPYLETISRPGMKMVFLLPAILSYADHWRERRMATARDMAVRLAAGLSPSCAWRRLDWEIETRTCEDKLYPICESLRKRGAETALHLYTGRVRQVLRNYLLSPDRDFIVIVPCGLGGRLKTLLSRAVFRSPALQACPPAMLLSAFAR